MFRDRGGELASAKETEEECPASNEENQELTASFLTIEQRKHFQKGMVYCVNKLLLGQVS